MPQSWYSQFKSVDYGLNLQNEGTYSVKEGRGTRDQIANICWITWKAREFQKTMYFFFTDYTEVFDCVNHKKTVENS